MMRITGGAVSGRRLVSIKELNVRPTSDRVRSSIFNMLGQVLTDLSILDLFAGTGSLGIEALSRGAKRAIFIDKSRRVLDILEKNLIICNYESQGRVIRKNLPNGLSSMRSMGFSQFDLVFIDPPYKKGYIEPTILKLLQYNLLSCKGILVVESSKEDDYFLVDNIQNLKLTRRRSYGSTSIGIYYYYEKE